MVAEWDEFTPGLWVRDVNVREFIQRNYVPYEGDVAFLVGASPTTKTLQSHLTKWMAHPANWTQKLTTTRPENASLLFPLLPWAHLQQRSGMAGQFSGMSANCAACQARILEIYTQDIRLAQHHGLLAVPSSASHGGQVMADYRRVPLYGVDRLIDDKKTQFESLELDELDELTIRLRAEVATQIEALFTLKQLAQGYGCDLGRPAKNTQEALQWLYFAYLAVCREEKMAVMLGRISTFLDIYCDRDLRQGRFTETQLQEFIDQFMLTIRMLIHQLSQPSFSGHPDPVQDSDYSNPTLPLALGITECIGGMGEDGRPLVTRTSFRLLNTLLTLGVAPEPTLTVLWSQRLPPAFKHFCARLTVDTHAIQYVNDDLMRPVWGDDYGLVGGVSALRVGQDVQVAGFEINLAKALLYAINGGQDESSGEQVAPQFAPIQSAELTEPEVWPRWQQMLKWLTGTAMNASNIVQFISDRDRERGMATALCDRDVVRRVGCHGMGLATVTDALAAMRYGHVKAVRNETGLVVDYELDGPIPRFGNGDRQVDAIATRLMETFDDLLQTHHAYRQGIPRAAMLSLGSPVQRGLQTGNTPDGRKGGMPLPLSSNPGQRRDTSGAIATLTSLAQLPYHHAQGGIGSSLFIQPSALGKTCEALSQQVVGLLDYYAAHGGQQLGITIVHRHTLLDAMEHPELYPHLLIGLSGYSVNFTQLSRDQQRDIINQMFHDRL
jgi:formate C-acetyltransferase